MRVIELVGRQGVTASVETEDTFARIDATVAHEKAMAYSRTPRTLPASAVLYI